MRGYVAAAGVGGMGEEHYASLSLSPSFSPTVFSPLLFSLHLPPFLTYTPSLSLFLHLSYTPTSQSL